VRSLFIILPAKRVELILFSPAHVSRNFDEFLRVLGALRLSSKHKVATPPNWQPRDDTVVLPFVTDDEAECMFADKGGLRKVGADLRVVRDGSLRVL
jgi:alkyl hydroperoxide reductase subunit AhpC